MKKYHREQEFLVKFGERLREVRKSKNISQADLAYTLELPPSQIGRIERGTINTSLSHMYSICKALDITPEELFKFKL